MGNSTISTRVAYEPLRSITAANISGTYAAIGTPFISAARQLNIKNFTNANVIISLDGVTDHKVIASGSGEILDYCSNTSINAGEFVQSALTTVYVRDESAASTSGSVYVELVYALSN